MTLERPILVGTRRGLHQLGSSAAPALDGHPVRALAAAGEKRWAAVGEGALWQRVPGGEWEHHSELDGPRPTCLFAREGELLIGTEEAHLLRLTGETPQPLTSFDRAPTRNDWFTPWGGPPAVRSLDVDQEGTIYANVHVGGILRSKDEGASWEPTLDLGADVHQVRVHPPSNTLFAPSGRGLAISHDRGDQWRFDSEGLHGSYLRAVAFADDVLLVSASTGAHTRKGAVYRRRLRSGDPFRRCTEGLPDWFPGNINTYCLASAERDVVLGTDRGEVYLSEDKGESWRALTQDLPPVECVQF